MYQLPVGAEFVAQIWIPDPGASQGLAASNALLGLVL